MTGCPGQLRIGGLPYPGYIEITRMTGSGPFQIEAVDTHECHGDIIAAIRGQRVVTRRRDLDAHPFFQANAANRGAPLYRNSEQCHSSII